MPKDVILHQCNNNYDHIIFGCKYDSDKQKGYLAPIFALLHPWGI